MPKALTLVQITDPHLHAVSEGTLLGMNTENSLKLIVERILNDAMNIDLIIATGDIAQDSSEQAYRNFLQHISPLSAPMRWIPGNHDNRENMATVSAGTDHAESVVEMDDWVIVLLDSTVPGKVYGALADDQLQLLKQALGKYTNKHILVTFHHHPTSMNSKWIDKIGVQNYSEFRDVISGFDNVRAVVCGHVHQDTDHVVEGVRYISTPSTCVQFKPESEDFGIDSTGPGYRILTLNTDGSIDTEVRRIEGVDFEIDYTQKGY